MNVVYCVTGSIAEKLSSKLVNKMEESGHIVYPIYTETTHFFPLYENKDRHYLPSKLNMESEVRAYYEHNKVWHVDVANWADVLVIAPCTANTIGKIVNGICDSPQLSLVTAFIGMNKRMIVAPVMNTNMYNNPFVQENISRLSKVAHIIDPTVKELACGDFGIGAMPDINAVIDIINDYHWCNPLAKWHEDVIFSGKDIEFYNYLPKYNEPGSFGFIRKHDIHTGVDIYCNASETKVLAVEDGEVIDKGIFTGASVNSDWWNQTYYCVIKGQSGYVLYGEINESRFNKGDKVKKGDYIADVIAVLPEEKIRKDIRNHSNFMLHLELYKEYDKPIIWNLKEKRNKNLLDPTPYLKNALVK